MYQTRYHFVPQTTSTNDEARDPRYSHGDMIRTEFQTAGRGQRGHVWTSPKGENLIVSIVWEPVFLPASQQFLISEAVSLALVDTMVSYGIEASIKWTNDIYVGDRKLVGTLIENNLSGGNIARSIPGIGINVNQTEFDPSLPNPCSMRQILGRSIDRDELQHRLAATLAARYDQLENGDREALQADYRSHMYRLNEEHPYRYPDGRTVMAVLRGVRPSGELLLDLPDGRQEGFLFKEIEFVIEAKERAGI